MFRALDYINYSSLKTNPDQRSSTAFSSTAAPLQYICCDVLCAEAPSRPEHLQWLHYAIHILPPHLLTNLLQVAVKESHRPVICRIIARWPLSTLCLRDMLSADTFGNTRFDIVLFRALVQRHEFCKMQCLDMRGLQLSREFCVLVVQLWPIISLPQTLLANVKQLVHIVVTSRYFKSSKLKFSESHFTHLLEQKISKMLAWCRDFCINFCRGHNLLVKLDGMEFFPGDKLLDDYFIAACLRTITPLKLQFSHLAFRNISAINSDYFVDLPNTVLSCHVTEDIVGLSLHQLEDGIFNSLGPVLCSFTNLQAIELQDCNIYLQDGITRSKTEDRVALCRFLAAFPQLLRLDLSDNYLVGCLSEVLRSVRSPLEFLSLRYCDVAMTDLRDLGDSHHATSIRELNLSKITINQYSNVQTWAPSDGHDSVLLILDKLPRLTILNLSHNVFSENCLQYLCQALCLYLPGLKVLDVSGILMSSQIQLDVCKACASIPCFQKIRLTLITSLVEELDNWMGQDAASACLLGHLRSLGRGDIQVESVLFYRSLFPDMVDELY